MNALKTLISSILQGMLISLPIVLVAMLFTKWWWILVAILVAIIPLAIIWVIASINKVEPNELAILIIFEEAKSELNSGIHFVPWCFGWNRIVKFPTTLWDITYPPIDVLTKSARYPNNPSGKEYGTANVSVTSVAYFRLPKRREMLVKESTEEFSCFVGDLNDAQKIELSRTGKTTYDGNIVILEKEHPIISIWRTGVPLNKEGLLDFTTESITGAIRLAVSEMTWKEANINLVGIQESVEKGFKKSDGALIVAGFRPSGIKISISNVKIPKEMEDAMANKEAVKDVTDVASKMASIATDAYNNWLKTPEGIAATPEEKKAMLEIIRQQVLSANGNFTESALALKGPGNQPLPAGLQYLAIGDGGGAGVLVGGSNSGKGRNRDKRTGNAPKGKPFGT